MCSGQGDFSLIVADAPFDVAPIVITATRIAQPSSDLPVSIDRVTQGTLHPGQLQVNLSESLLTVPGVSVQSRQNYAQDLQISVRGFGARSSFGVRGVRLYADGIPGTLPDGQGQFSQFDLGSADHIEVLRGPFSALYGNSSGGVIAVFTADAKPGFAVDGTSVYGTFDTQRYALRMTGDQGAVNYVVDAAHFQTSGYRYHSQAERNNFNARVRFELTSTSRLTLIGNAVQTPFVQDPLGLTRAQVAADPAQAGTGAVAYDTRKDLAQEQFGMVYDTEPAAHEHVTSTAYTGHRTTTQFQSIPQAVQQATALYPGGVIDLSRAFFGVESHLTDRHDVGATQVSTTFGLSYEDLAEARKGYANYVGNEPGVQGSLRRDEANHVYDFDQYLQAQWDSGSRWLLIAGVRNSAVQVSSRDHLSGSGTASGVRYSALDPVGGATFRATSRMNLYASYGKGFETPTLNDLAYRSTDGSLPGLNLALRPARSDNYEAGLKAGNASVRINLAGFYIKTTNELAVLANANGRTVNQNIGETTRHGAELALDADLTAGFAARVAYTYMRAVVARSYTACVGTPCAQTATGAGSTAANGSWVVAGSRLPGVPMNSLYAGVTWTQSAFGFTATLEAQGRAQIQADDRNSAAAAGYWVANVRAGFEQNTHHWQVSEFASLDNLTDRRYVGSVIVNDVNLRFFEPAPGRTAYLMFSAGLRSK